MSIDPRIMKQMIKTQLAPNLDFKTVANPLGTNKDKSVTSLFDMLLSQYMHEASNGSSEGTDVSAQASEALAQLASLNNAYQAEGETFAAGSTDYDAMIAQAAAQYGVDPALIRGVIRTESGFQPDVVSGAGAKGLMQLMDGTARGLGVTDSLNPQQNIDGGTRYLSFLLRKYNGNEQVALAAYNAGPGRIDRLGITTDSELMANLDKLPEETQRYIVKVQAARY
ncbi:lytic transglycosylase [Paenibacillus sp. BIHB 4019]|uniref:Lytic transglycosylase n=1 Tax=Paenibacillus sp. BIHB 4019 TaxID=1870819 RepID=A0A1B2DQK0_9BACL|nr:MULTISPECIES: lytic transglycosylase domain-containing protein [unclassified Paenibacillus]ANY69977.1 lytic transglycosylase [Paenibacillus sp. BIHB 4019]KQN97665.1 lytic transglycosylase [Paenibacillus sp. Leaf72]